MKTRKTHSPDSLGSAAAASSTQLTTALFKRFCRIAHDQAGISLKDGKEALVSARVSKRVRHLGLPSLRSYLEYLEADESGEELVHFLDVITTNFTRFFREPEHFDDLQRFVESRARRGQERFTIWCAAASTGEEPYTIAMSLKTLIEQLHLEVRILATDISTRVLHTAMEGRYSDKSIAELADRDRKRFFVREGRAGTADPTWLVRPELRSLIVFDRLNLAQPPFPMKGPFDVIFCRNVMIYFTPDVRATLVHEMERLLAPEGLLILGHAETLSGMKTALKPLRPSVYQKTAHAHRTHAARP